MPDWSYHPVFRPLLFRLRPEAARDITLGALGALARLPLGPQAIDFLGHLRPPTSLGRTAWGIAFPGPVGLAAGLDIHAVALPALAQFGFGFLEAGPVTLAPLTGGTVIERCDDQQALLYSNLPMNDGLDMLAARLDRVCPLPIPLGIRLGHCPGASAAQATSERIQLIERLGRYAAFFTLETRGALAAGWRDVEWTEHLSAVAHAVQNCATPRPLLLCLAADLDLHTLHHLLDSMVASGLAGAVITDDVAWRPDARLVGPEAHELSLSMVRAIRGRCGDSVTIIAAGGVHAPADALELLAAGAAFVEVHSGLVYAGPGLPKRINDLVANAYPAPRGPAASLNPRLRAFYSWPSCVWIALLGAAMLFGGILAWLIAITRVVLPYDELFVGLSRADLATINARLLPFMAHDRVTLAGTMISIGVLYGQLALHGMRRGADWAREAVLVSAVVGFASFFLFLGFGYFDPLHALVAVLLLPLFVFGMRGSLVAMGTTAAPNEHNDWRWRLGLWGQLLFVGIGFGLALAGCVIAGVGMTSVFVPEDLAFLRTTPGALGAITPRLIALAAHDRAGFGGALVSDGLALLLASLWGFGQGARWLWWTFVAAGVPGFVAAFGIHLAVGYTNLWHLAPAIAALVFYLLALTLSYPYLCQVATPLKAPDVVVVDETAGPSMAAPAYDRDQPVSEA